jgi:hypothetical protein
MDRTGKLPKMIPTPEGNVLFVGIGSKDQEVGYIEVDRVFIAGKMRPVYGQTYDIPPGHPSPSSQRRRSYKRVVVPRFG